MTSIASLLAQLTEMLLAVLLAPMLSGWVSQCRAWLQRHLPGAALVEASSTSRAVQIAAGEAGAAARQNLYPRCRATTPPVRLKYSTCDSPTCSIIFFSVSWSGCMRIDSAK